MKSFAFSLVARYTDGVTLPLTGHVSAPVADDTDHYTCSFDCPLLGGGGQFRSRYPEWAYSKAVLWLRFNMEGLGFEIRDGAGRKAEIAAPVMDDFGIPCFAPARFHGRALHKGALAEFTAEVQPPEPDPRGGWGCPVRCSLYGGRLGPIHSDWPEHAYELSFALLRNLLGGNLRDEVPPVDISGAPLLIRAPVRPPRSR